jgi:hypothetical protein
MISAARKFIKTLTKKDRLQIFYDQATWENAGSIGDTVLRTKGEELLAMPESYSNISICMMAIAHEVWRHEAMLNLKLFDYLKSGA